MTNSKRLYIDFETRSVVDLKKEGLSRYISHPSTSPICFAYAFDNEPVQLWRSSELLPDSVIEHIIKRHLVVAHNAAFDRSIWNLISTGVSNWFINQTIDTQAKCRAAGIPPALADAAQFLGLKYQKMTTGKLLIKRLSYPKSIDPLVWNENPKALEMMYEYCKMDVETMRELDLALPDLSEKEQKVWCLDQKINHYGVHIDREFCEKSNRLVTVYKQSLENRMKKVTNGIVNSPTEVKKLTQWATHEGADLKTIGKQDIIAALEKPLPSNVKEALTIRKDFAKSSTAKLQTVLNQLSIHNRLTDQFVYHGANTGRWAGRAAQLQNLPRFSSEIDYGELIKDIKNGQTDFLLKWGLTPAEAVSSSLRGMIIASNKMMLYGADYSAIEARVLAWLADQSDILDRFSKHEDVYLYTASKIFGRVITAADKEERMIGKVAVLALGYQGGEKAFDKMAKNYGVDVPQDKRLDIVQNFRETNYKIVQYWKEVDEAALTAMEFPGTVVSAGPLYRSVCFLWRGNWLLLKLPSGRKLSYPCPSIVINEKWGRRIKQVTYQGKIANKTGMFPIEMYGGKWVENITQAVARDCMVEGMFNATAKGYAIVGTIHDEIIAEKFRGDLDEFCQGMTTESNWNKGLPLEVKGWFGERYLK